jgi:hypothetical protein
MPAVFNHRHMKSLIAALMIFAGITSARSQGIVVSEELKSNSTVLDAKGRQGWQFNQVITFGGFHTSKIKRSWPAGIDISFIERFRAAKEKLSFTQYSPDSLICTIVAVSRFLSDETDFLNGFMGYSFVFQNSFAGCIIPQNDTENSWEFLVTDPDVVMDKNAGCGMARDKNGRQISIHGVTKMEGQPKWVPGQVWGFEFFMDGKSIAAVSIAGNGKVYLKNDLSPEMRLVISAISSSLMVRHNLMDES